MADRDFHSATPIEYPTLVEAIAARNATLASAIDQANVLLGVEETEDLITALYELVGHMGDDVGIHGYEARLIARLKMSARRLQAALLASILPWAATEEHGAESLDNGDDLG